MIVCISFSLLRSHCTRKVLAPTPEFCFFISRTIICVNRIRPTTVSYELASESCEHDPYHWFASWHRYPHQLERSALEHSKIGDICLRSYRYLERTNVSIKQSSQNRPRENGPRTSHLLSSSYHSGIIDQTITEKSVAPISFRSLTIILTCQFAYHRFSLISPRHPPCSSHQPLL